MHFLLTQSVYVTVKNVPLILYLPHRQGTLDQLDCLKQKKIFVI